MNTLKLASLTLALTLGAFGTSIAAEPPAHQMFAPEDLQWADVAGLPAGAKMAVIEGPTDQAVPFTFRVKFPAGYRVPAHWHPAAEHVTVLSGAVNLGLGDKLDKTKTHPLVAGGYAIMPAEVHHFGWTDVETVIQVHGMGPWGITYVNPADDPRN
ncbi:MAG TPA: cupin domain-containing protein, partial [Lysobacter sp.]|nr:cupin domain-containing protein [Lysobacter sp.]